MAINIIILFIIFYNYPCNSKNAPNTTNNYLIYIDETRKNFKKSRL